MADISIDDAISLASIIYAPGLEDDWLKVVEDVKTNGKCSVAELIESMEKNLGRDTELDNYGAEMSKEQFWRNIDKIKQSEMLMSLEVKDITDNKNTYFRAMTLIDPNNPSSPDPKIVFRGTAGNYQWDDNFSAVYSSLTPSQQEAIQYVVRSGYDHVELVGHSKAGTMGATVAYLLPEGMVDKVYSIDGQGASRTFLSQIPKEKQDFASKLVENHNEYRDIVSNLLQKMGIDENTFYTNSGVVFKNDQKKKTPKLYFFHPHIPTVLNDEGAREIGRPSALAGAINDISMGMDNNDILRFFARAPVRGAAKLLHGNEMEDTSWSKEFWFAVYDAEKIYKRVNKKRSKAILEKLSAIFQVDFSKYKLMQEEGSLVVEGAVLTCSKCSGIGALTNIEDHGNIIQGKAVASKRDTQEGTNICMEKLDCSVIDFDTESVDTTERICKPEIGGEWLITDTDKTLYIDGENVEAVLKKSVLGCWRGGMIEVVHNGQLNLDDIEKRDKIKEFKGKMKIRIKDHFSKNLKKMGLENPVTKIKDWHALAEDLAGIGYYLPVIGTEANMERAVAVAEKGAELVNEGSEKISGGFRQRMEDLENQINSIKEQYIRNIINDKLKYR